jgi:hypothetical protein
MKTPISVNEHGDISIFATIKDAELYMEPLDVERGEYIVTDATGRELSVSVVIEESTLFWGVWKSQQRRVRISEPT